MSTTATGLRTAPRTRTAREGNWFAALGVQGAARSARRSRATCWTPST